jgi:hypothetical protein
MLCDIVNDFGVYLIDAYAADYKHSDLGYIHSFTNTIFCLTYHAQTTEI